MMKKTLLLVLPVILAFQLHSQQVLQIKTVRLLWQFDASGRLSFQATDTNSATDALMYREEAPGLPFFTDRIRLFDAGIVADAYLEHTTVEPITNEELLMIGARPINEEFELNVRQLTGRNEAYVSTSLLPFRKNTQTGTIEKLTAFTLTYTFEWPHTTTKNSSPFAEQSVLASGNWHKIRIKQSGIYKITTADLQAIGINTSGIDPRNIRIYGNGGGTLPESNSAPRYDDLVENPIEVVGEADGVMNQNDYILFYGQGPLVWDFNAADGFFKHRPNYYDDYAYYYITTDLGSGKRIATKSQPSNPSETVTAFLDYALYEQDLYNLSNTGRTWYGDLFDVNLNKDFNFSFPGILTNKNAKADVQLAARSFGASGFQLTINDQITQTLPIEATQATGYDWAKSNGTSRVFFPNSDNVKVNLTYNRAVSSARGWLDYISLNAWRNLSFTGNQMHFNYSSFNDGHAVVQMQLANATNTVIWDITEAINPQKIIPQTNGTTASFNTGANSLKRFIAFSESGYLSVEGAGVVANQNLHGLRDVDYLIISHPDFLTQAEQLANIHRTQSSMNVYVTTPQLIYNEFSSGAQDITAIRDFARMLYTRSTPGRELKYLLMFGDASFDYKDKIEGNTNFVPTFQSVASLNLVNSIATDDYFGYLDVNENGNENSILDIGIGRFPVATVLEAQQMVDKVIRYLSDEDDVHGPWRNEVTFVSDDGDSNNHINDSETIADLLRQDYPDFNLEKIHLDAYKQIATPGGQKAPDVNEAINRRIERGTLIVNYSGHGGEVGWTEERILQIADINAWRNRSKLPVFITATCEFSRYDDAQRTSAGEMVFLNPYGGAIAMFTTARATYSTTNLRLNKAIFNDNIFTRINGEYPRFGDVIRKSKIAGDANDRKFVLLGDPALQISFPHEKVVTTHINGQDATSLSDTLKALDLVTVKGQVTNRDGLVLNNFNGILYATVYDKETEIQTYGDQNPVSNFMLRNSIINKSTVEVKDGLFEFSFMIPKDISYKYGTGRISYYATDGTTDAQGYYEDFVVGGFSNNQVNDQAGPQIRLFIGDTTFVDGGFTDENPRLVALLSDENGINTTGSGIGHDLIATLSGETETYAIINEFYNGKLNAKAEGTVIYPFANLNPGRHTLTLKAWDILNNSSTASIGFEVIPSSGMRLENARNYPNPFSESTRIVVNHNQSSEPLDIEVQIFSTTGQLIRTLVQNNQFSDGYTTPPVIWNGRAENGQLVPKGLYLYRVIVTNSDGNQSESRSKLLFY